MGASTWDDTPAPAANNSWKANGGNSGGGWEPDGAAGGDDGFEISGDNTSKHAGGDFDDALADGGCRTCGQPGHFARDCPDKPAGSGECYNCGEDGHVKSECPNPRVEREFTGECRLCGVAGHRASDCPDAPPSVCKLCHLEGHIATDCSVNRMHSMFANLGIQDMNAEDAWKLLVAADKEKDVEDIKTAIFAYANAFPELTFEELEKAFRDSSMNTFLIAKEQEVTGVWTAVNLQGKTEQKFVVTIQFSNKPRRVKFAEGWPSSDEDNFVRLAEAGIPMDSLQMKCSNCSQVGHGSKSCPEEKNEGAKVVITCAVCSGEGHRARDCTEPRKSNKKGCRNCGSEEHIAKECPEPRSAENVECKNCSRMGHFSKDCPDREPEICRNCFEEGHRAKDCQNERVMKCRNCDEIGHMSRECSKPTDWSRVKCSNCFELGHSYKRCTKPPKPAEEETTGGGDGDGGWGGDGGSTGGSGGGSGGWETGADDSAGGSGGFEASSGGGW